MYNAQLIIEIKDSKGREIRQSMGVQAEDFTSVRQALLDMVFYRSQQFAESVADEANFQPATKVKEKKDARKGTAKNKDRKASSG